jgi:hypothetical protein
MTYKGRQWEENVVTVLEGIFGRGRFWKRGIKKIELKTLN